MTEFAVALDQGGQSSRAIAFDRRGQACASAVQQVATTHPAPGRYEQDPDALAASIQSVLGKTIRALPVHARAVVALGTQRSSIVCWDRQTGRALSPVLSWRDRRNADWLASLGLDPAWLHAITGLRASPHYGAAKLRWCLDNLPAVAQAREEDRLAFGPLASFLAFRLSAGGVFLADPVNASRTLLMDIGSGSWSADLIDRFGLPAEALPPVIGDRQECGEIRIGDVSLPLLLTTGDQAAALYAQGEPDRHTVFVNAGTGAFALQKAGWPNPERRLLTSVVGSGTSGLEVALEGTVNGAASALETEAKRLHINDWITIAEAGLPAGAAIPVFLNGHSGLGSPWWRDVFPCRYRGEGAAEARLIAVLESIIFMLTVNVDLLGRRTDAQSAVRISGGLSHLDGFCQRLADLVRLPVERPPQVEATARGLAWLSFGSDQDWRLPAGAVFEPRHNEDLEDRFARWRSCMEEALHPDTV